MAHTKFRTLTNEELLSLVQTARFHSPIIDELASRFEQAEFGESDVLAETEESAQKPRAFACPICNAELLGSVNLIDDCVTVEIRK
jgi:6,7-dimethyl-8-ribityllumazine synthase